jgi:DNA-binding transcriptional regulator YiaG
MGVLSNPEAQEVLAQAAQTVAGITFGTEQTATPSQSRRWRLVDRLGRQAIHELLRDSQAGITQKELATRYGISVSSVKKLLSSTRARHC